MKTTSGPNAPIPLPRKLLYYTILALIPVLFLGATECLLRLFNVGSDLSLFRRAKVYKEYYEINPAIGKRYFSRLGSTDPNNDIFLAKKPDSCFRIFVMGESTAEGFPYEPGIMFSRILQYRLQDAFPNRRIEVVNLGIAAVSSYTHLDFADEIIAHHPDLILIYAGHNEYYGTLGIASVENGGNARWIKLLQLRLIRLRTYQMVQRGVSFILPLFTGRIYQKATLMERIAQGKTIVYGSKAWQAGVEQYRANMADLLRKFKRAGVPVIMSEEVCNIHDLVPFKSIPSGSDPGAAVLFEKARSLEAKGDFIAARACYYEAKDHDAIPFRAPEALNKITRDLGRQFGDTVIHLESWFEARSPHGLVGHNLILEHVHPNVDGYFLIADAFFTTMRQDRFIAADWDSSLIKPAEYYRNNWGFTPFDSLAAAIKIKQIAAGWPFNTRTGVNNFQETYVPSCYEDSLAYDCVIHETMHVEDGHVKLAKRYAAQGNNRAAYNEYLSLIKSYPYGVALYKKALACLDSSDLEKALDLLLSMPNKNESVWAQTAMGTLCLNLRRPVAAAAFFAHAQALLKPGDTSLNALTGLYNSYVQLGDAVRRDSVAAVIRSLRPGVDFDLLTSKPEDAPKLLDLAVAEVKRKNIDRAMVLLRKSLELRETFEANFLLGRIYFEKKDLHALRYLERAYSENPKDPALLVDLTILYYVDKNLAKASRCLDEYRRGPHDPSQAAQLARIIEKGRAEGMGR